MARIFVGLILLLLGFGEIRAQQDLEGSVPGNWAASPGSLAISGNHSKIGMQSLRWDWSGGGAITVSSPGISSADVTGFYKNTCDLWIWNGTAIPGGKLRIEFMNGSTAQYWFDVYLDYTGWRRAVRSYTNDMSKKSSPSATFTSVRISAPASGSGSFYFDAVTWAGDRFTRFVDGPNPDIAGYYSSAKYSNALANVPDIAATSPTASELAELATVRARWISSAKGSSAPGSSSVNSAGTSFAALNIVDAVTGIRGNPMGPDTPLEGWPLTLARDYSHATATADASRDKMLLLVRHLLDQGMAYNSSDEFWGGVGDYSFRDLPKGMILMADAYDPAVKAQLWDFMRWHYVMGRFWGTNWERNTDDMHTGIYQTLGAILLLTPDDTEAVRMLKGFKRHVERFLVTSQGGEDGIKPDGTGFHHRSHYNNYMYAFPTMSNTLHFLRDTGFQVDLATYQQFRGAFLAMMRMSADATGANVGYFGNSLCGRKAFDTNLTFGRDDLRRLGEWGGRITGQNADSVVAQAYNRRFGVNDYSLFAPYGVAAPEDGFHQFSYSPLGIYRRSDWVVSIRAPQKYFWSSEIYPAANRYGRYQSYGALEVLYSGGRSESGQQPNGWDWNHTPGSTTIVLPDSKLVAESDREDVRSELNYSGALQFQDGQSGLYACNFQEDNAGANHNPSFVWRKSWFFFDNQIVCLGSDIANDDADNPTATTLFQGKLESQSTAITLDGGSVINFPYSNTASGTSAHWLLDAFRTGYYVYPGTTLKITRSNQSSPNQSGSGSRTTADFSKAWLDHGKAPIGAGYEYVVFPGTDAAAMASSAALHGNPLTKPYEVVQRDTSAHVVKWKSDGKTAYAIYDTTPLTALTKGSGLLVSVERPCLVMSRTGTGEAWISVADPDLNFTLPTGGYGTVDASVPRTLDFTLKGVWTVDSAPAGVSIVDTSISTTTLRVTTQHGFPVNLHLLGTPGVWANFGPDWNDPANWISDLPANDTGTDLAVLGAATVQPVLGGAYAVKGMTMEGGTTLSGSGNLTLGAAGISSTGNANVISTAGLTLAASQVWDIAGGDVTVAALISGGASNTLTKSGSGSLTLSGANSYTGTTIVSSNNANGGIVSVAGDQSAAGGGWTINGTSSVNFQSGSTIVLAAGKNITLNNSNGSHSLTVEGTVTTSSTSTLAVRARSTLNLDLGTNWTQSGPLVIQPLNSSYSATVNVKIGSGFTYDGSTNITLARSSSGGSGSAALNLNGGTFTTSRAFSNNAAGTGSGSTTLTFSNGGTLKLSADIASLIIEGSSPFGVVTNIAASGVIDTNGFSTAIAVAVSGDGGLTKAGAGTLILSGANTHTGATTVEGGTLSVTGTLADTPVEVQTGGSLVLGGNLGGSLTVRDGGHLGFALAATPGAQTGRTIAGALALNSGNVIDLTTVTVPTPGDYVLATALEISGPVGTVNLPAGVSGNLAIVGNSLRLTVSASPYAAWISGYPVGGMTALDDDFDQDGIPNGIEFVLGGDPSVPSPNGLQILATGGNSRSLLFSRNDAAKYLTFSCEVSGDLVAWPTGDAYQIGADTASSTAGVVISNNLDAGPDTVTVTVPTTGKERQFLRLKVSE